MRFRSRLLFDFLSGSRRFTRPAFKELTAVATMTPSRVANFRAPFPACQALYQSSLLRASLAAFAPRLAPFTADSGSYSASRFASSLSSIFFDLRQAADSALDPGFSANHSFRVADVTESTLRCQPLSSTFSIGFSGYVGLPFQSRPRGRPTRVRAADLMEATLACQPLSSTFCRFRRRSSVGFSNLASRPPTRLREADIRGSARGCQARAYEILGSSSYGKRRRLPSTHQPPPSSSRKPST